jgi:hypothetical protein
MLVYLLRMAEKKSVKEKVKEKAKNLYKKNPLAKKLSDKEAYYRAVNKEAFDDYIKNKVVRASSTGKPLGIKFGGKELSRGTEFPAFQKGKVLESYLPKEGNGYIYESKRPMVARGEVNPITGLRVTGRHFASRPFDPFTGETVRQLNAAEVRAFEGKPNWLMGYKEVGKGYPVVQAAKEAAKRTATGVAKGAAAGAAFGVASAAIEPVAEAAMKEYEKRAGVSTPDPKSVAGRLRRFAVRGGPLGAPYDLAESATELATEIVPESLKLAYERMIESPAREQRLEKATKKRAKEKRKPIKNPPKIKDSDK